ncbi:MAG: HAMP domain-containing histidine kinase [Proteobacteria bacterium]|nr:HAMP domain-containing histidine kinase [Pseudomonadota bacterium]
MCDRDDDLTSWRLTQSKLTKLFIHDLKNPISALSANLSFLESALVTESEDARGAVSDSILASEMLLRFCENLNLVTMLECGESSGIGQVGLQSFVQAIVKRNNKFAVSAGVRLETEEPLGDASLYCQYRYAELAIENLILSAVRHSPQGNEVRISCRVDGEEACISILDHGRPVEEQCLKDLFTREKQSDAKKHPGCRYGRGLGLYAVGLAAKALRGQINVGTRDGMTEFALKFPLTANE